MSLLGYALLGLLYQAPRSGYDLRKIFSTTPLSTFSDSPGSIYPALHRLQRRGLISSRVEERPGLRRRRLFSMTDAGLLKLRRRQSQPITDASVIRGVDDLMLRFGFMDESLGAGPLVAFSAGLEAGIGSLYSNLARLFGKA